MPKLLLLIISKANVTLGIKCYNFWTHQNCKTKALKTKCTSLISNVPEALPERIITVNFLLHKHCKSHCISWIPTHVSYAHRELDGYCAQTVTTHKKLIWVLAQISCTPR